MGSILQVKQDGRFVDVPALRGKSAYEQALEGGLDITEEQFNNLMANIISVDSQGESTPYKIQFVGQNQEPDENTPDNIITIVLKS